MNSFSRRAVSRLSDRGIKIYACSGGGNHSYTEWLKWLSYVPTFQKTRIEELSSKMVENLSFHEVQEVYEYKNQVRMLDLFQKYGTGVISREEYLEVYDFMVNNSIHNFMLSKLSLEEIDYAKGQIQYFSDVSEEVLNQKVEEEWKDGNYEKLSMVDAYILHVISSIKFKKNRDDFNRRIDAILTSNDVMCPKKLEKMMPCTYR